MNDFDNPEFEGREKYPQSGVHGNDVFSARHFMLNEHLPRQARDKRRKRLRKKRQTTTFLQAMGRWGLRLASISSSLTSRAQCMTASYSYSYSY
jgi:hypothetical protein